MKFLILSLAFTKFVIASGNMKDHKHQSVKTEITKLNENKNFNLALVKYEVLAQAFFDNKNENVKKAALELAESIKKIDDNKIKKTLEYSKSKLIEISKSDNIENNQASFSTVSQSFYVVLTKYAGNKDYVRYYCPMVKKYWLQNVEKTGGKTKNVYASSSMPECGGIK
jgi:hypothetical protein